MMSRSFRKDEPPQHGYEVDHASPPLKEISRSGSLWSNRKGIPGRDIFMLSTLHRASKFHEARNIRFAREGFLDLE